MNRLEEFKIIKQKYENLRDLYFMTRNSHHFMIFQQAFKEYRSFIDRHNITPREIQSLMSMTLQDCLRVVREIKKAPVPPQPSMRRKGALDSQQKILDFMATQREFVSINEISSCVLLSFKGALRAFLF